VADERHYSRAHIYVEGYVQGVGFRYFVVREAGRLNITGWVRNLYDGRVEIVAEGEEDDIDSFIGVVRRGPPAARVDDVKVEKVSIDRPEHNRFNIEYSGF